MKSIFLILSLINVQLLCAQRTINIEKINQEIKIDGNLKEGAWKQIEFEEGFTQNYPKTGQPATQKTVFKVLYDDNALYLGVILHDTDADSIFYTLSERDDLGNGDWFGIIIDPYQGGNNGFGYFVTAAGVQRDAYYLGEDGDGSWNSVWLSKTTKTDSAWILEMKIPFSAIRFPKEDIQTWNINFSRQIRRNRETSYWNPVNPEKFGLLNQFGIMKGIEGIKPPVRLSFSPYLSAFAKHFPNPNAKNWEFGWSGGMDIKYGINDAFTLDMTLVPDFTQVRSDDQVLNLSPFEIRFDENRQFFTEGMELFNIGDIFYTRRIGGVPLEAGNIGNQIDTNTSEYVSKNPAITQLINATKISGRTKKGLGIGVLNAITNRTTAVISDTLGGARNVITDPWTNYNAFSLSQNLPNNSVISFMNTNVTREGAFYDANVSSLETRILTKENTYAFSGGGNLSYLYGPNINNKLGYKINVAVEKISGRIQGDVFYNEVSDKYDINDMGFQFRNNSRQMGFSVGHYTYKKIGKLYRSRIVLDINHDRLYSPDGPEDLSFNVSMFAVFLNFMAAGANVGGSPFGQYDYYEPRVWGKKYFRQPSYNIGGWISTDYSKIFAFDASMDYTQFVGQNRGNISGRVSPRVRASDMLSFIYSLRYNYNHNQEGYAFYPYDDLPAETSVFGKRNTHIVENNLTIDFIFTNRMGINVRLRHYWARVDYNSFYILNNEGTLDYFDYDGLDADGNSVHDINYNAFTIDFVYKWVFQPGSELSLVWKNSIYTNGRALESNYFKNFGDMITSPATNTLSLKVLYYLDVLYFKQWSKKKKEL